METQDPDVEACRELFTELEFTSMLRELAPSSSAPAAELIDQPTAEQAAAFYDAAQKHGFAFALAAEEPTEEEPENGDAVPQTLSLLDVVEEAEKKTRSSVGVCADPGRALCLPLSPELRKLFEDEAVPKRVHDLKLALHVLGGLDVRSVAPLTTACCFPTPSIPHTQRNRWLTWPLVTISPRRPLCPQPPQPRKPWFPLLRAEAERSNVTRVYEEIDLPLAPVLYRMEKNGVRIDTAVLDGLSKRFAAEMERVGETIFSTSPDAASISTRPNNLAKCCSRIWGFLPLSVRGKGKAISTAQDVLEQLAEANEVPRLVLEFRHLSKLKSNYVDSLPLLADSESRVHTTFQAAATSTGRLSSVNPNLQNIPIKTELGREIRAAFIAAPGTQLLSADYSQIELRLLAHFSGDPLLVRAYQQNDDIHTLTASEVFGVPADTMDKETRNRAKAVNFGIVYGISPFGLAAQLGIPQPEARAYIDRYFARYQGVKSFIEKTLEATRREGSVRTLFGRVRPIPDIESRNPNQRGFAERTAVNTPLQGTAADLIKLAMIALDRKLADRKLKTRMVLQVHDELLFEVPEAETEEVEQLVRARDGRRHQAERASCG